MAITDVGSIISLMLSGFAIIGGVLFWFTQFGQLRQLVMQNSEDLKEFKTELKDLESYYKSLDREREAMGKEIIELSFATKQLKAATDSLNSSLKEMITMITQQNSRITEEIVKHASCKYYSPGQKPE